MTNDDKLRDYLKKVTVDLHDVRSRLHELEHQNSEPMAIVGIGCRYPGGVSSQEQMWELVRDGRDAVSEAPNDRGWDLRQLYDPEPGRPGATYTREGGFLGDATDFDSDFFSISPKEALAMDPQQRLLLETAWEAIENADIAPGSLRGSPTAVFVGGESNGYGLGPSGSVPIDVAGHYISGTVSSVMSGRISYNFGFEAPAVTIDTACSSALVALHLACGSLRAGECSLALVGGVCVMSTPTVFLEMSRQQALAPDGRCKSFADSADGAGWGEGAGVLLLERLSDARRLNHRILAVVRGSAVNQDGASNGLTAPSGPSQQRVIRDALANAQLSPHQVDVVEAHGTGTKLGDPIEAQALLATYGQGRLPGHPLWLGSIKSNIGHTQAAAGMAGVIKIVMAMQHELLPKTLHVDQPTQKVNWLAGSVSLLVEAEPWPRRGEPRRAGVSSFGISGTNAHVILEEPASHPAEVRGSEDEEDTSAATELARSALLGGGLLPLIVSARGDASLRAQAARISAHLQENPDLDMNDVGLSLMRRSAFDRRAVAIGGEGKDPYALLDAIADERSSADVLQGVVGPDGAGGIVFVFPGQGSQWVGMGIELLQRSSFFARSMEECAEAFAPFIDWSLLDALSEGERLAALDRVDIVQPVLFSLTVSLARLWQACGVRPDAVVGHSQGEITAVCVAGGLSLQDAARMVALRSMALRDLSGKGGMVSVSVAENELAALLEGLDGELSLGAVSGPRSMVMSGGLGALSELLVRCEERQAKARKVQIDYAAHSAHIEEIRKELLDAYTSIAPRSGELPFYSSTSGGIVDTAELDADSWYRNLREPVRFDRAIRALLDDGHRTFIEVSPHPILTMGMHETIDNATPRRPASSSGPEIAAGAETLSSVSVLGSLRRGDGGPRRFLASLSEAWVHGVEVKWETLLDGAPKGKVQLPSYPFQRKRYWLDIATEPVGTAAAGQVSIGHPLIRSAIPLVEGEGWLFTGRLSLDDQPWLRDHVIEGAVVVPGTTIVDLVLRVGAEVGCEVLEDLVHEAAITLSTDQPAVELQVKLAQADEFGKRAVGVFARPEDPVWEGGEVWTRHARGALLDTTYAVSEQTSASDGSVDAVVMGAWPAEGADPVPIEDLYDDLARAGLDYGPTFFSTHAAWYREGEAFTEVRLPEVELERTRQFGIHPALLDVSLQAVAILMRIEHPELLDKGEFPFAWTRVRLHNPGASSLRMRVSRSELGGHSLVAVDERGELVISADSVVFRSFTEDALRRMHGAAGRSLFHLDWVPASQSEIVPTTISSGDWVTLGSGKQESTQADAQDDWVAGAVAYPDLPSMIGAIEKGAPAPQVVWVRFLGGGKPVSQELPSTSRRVLERTLSIVQEWLAAACLEGSRLAIVTKGAVSAGSEADLTDLACAPVWGLLRSVQSEHPGRFVLLDVDVANPDHGVLAEALGQGEPQLALRGGKLLAPRLKRAVVPEGEVVPEGKSAEASPPEDESLPGDRALWPEGVVQSVADVGLLRSERHGSVLITGGTGWIGSSLARHLVERHGVRSVVLASRQGLQAEGAKDLRAELIELGAEVTIVACDMSDRDQVAKLIDRVPTEYPLCSIIHGAGAVDDGTIDAMSPERIDRVFKPKLDGAWYLHELTEQLELSAFVLLSSSAGTIGSPGQSNYAAANVFLDALAAHRHARGLPAVAMAWGLWSGSAGMAGAQSATDRARMERGGGLALSTEEGLRLFDDAYAYGESLMVPIRLNVATLQAQARAGVVAPLLKGLFRLPVKAPTESGRDSLLRRVAGAPERERERVVLDLVRAEVAVVLGHSSPEEIDPNRAFNELGFDSLSAIELRNRLSFASGIQLPATLVFDYPSSTALSDFLMEQISPELGGRVEGPPTDEDLRKLFTSIPLVRLREAGIMDTLMRLAGFGDASSASEGEPEELVEEMDVAALVQLSLGPDDALGELVEGG
jgi:acyl transferase domain-containing protein/acyl carrier protein